MSGRLGASLLVIAKLPVPSRVKTRLCPPCTPDEAAALAEASLRDTLAVAVSACRHRPDLFDGVVTCMDRAGLALPSWISEAGPSFDQCDGDLGARLAHAFETVGGSAFLVGMDTPQLTEALLIDAVESLASAGSVFGPATDGGFWSIGFCRPQPGVFDGVPMSTARTGDEQLLSMRRFGLKPAILPVLTDFDEFDEAVKLGLAIPGSGFSSAVAAVSARIAEAAEAAQAAQTAPTGDDLRPTSAPTAPTARTTATTESPCRQPQPEGTCHV